MKRRVYRSLDRPATVFGIRGRFMWVFALGGAQLGRGEGFRAFACAVATHGDGVGVGYVVVDGVVFLIEVAVDVDLFFFLFASAGGGLRIV